MKFYRRISNSIWYDGAFVYAENYKEPGALVVNGLVAKYPNDWELIAEEKDVPIPAQWRILITEENVDELNKFLVTHKDEYNNYKDSWKVQAVEERYFYYPQPKGEVWHSSANVDDHTIATNITTTTFLKYIVGKYPYEKTESSKIELSDNYIGNILGIDIYKDEVYYVRGKETYIFKVSAIKDFIYRKSGNIRLGKADYLKKEKRLSNGQAVLYVNNIEELRPATKQEKEHLAMCDEANKYVPYKPEIKKDFNLPTIDTLLNEPSLPKTPDKWSEGTYIIALVPNSLGIMDFNPGSIAQITAERTISFYNGTWILNEKSPEVQWFATKEQALKASKRLMSVDAVKPLKAKKAKDTTVVHVPNKEQYYFLLKHAEIPYLDSKNWESYKSQTCVRLNGGSFCNKVWYIKEGYTIVSFEGWLQAENLKLEWALSQNDPVQHQFFDVKIEELDPIGMPSVKKTSIIPEADIIEVKRI